MPLIKCLRPATFIRFLRIVDSTSCKHFSGMQMSPSHVYYVSRELSNLLVIYRRTPVDVFRKALRLNREIIQAHVGGI